MKNHTPPLWKSFALAATMLAAAVFILAINAYLGAALFIIGVFLQTYGGFTTAQPIQGETRVRIGALAFAWILLVCLSVAMQSVVPQFTGVLNSFGSGLPPPTIFTMRAFPLLLLLPLLVALAWNFWPRKASRLRAAAISSWCGVGVTLLMFGSLYLPLFYLGAVE